MAHGAGALTAAGEGRYGGCGRARARTHGALAHVARAHVALARRALLFVAVLAATVAHGQVKQSVAAAYGAAEQALVVAIETPLGRAASPDDAVWRAALDAASLATSLAVAAEQAAPLDAQESALEASRRAYRLEARAYGLTNWYSRAFAAWDGFLASGGELTDTAPQLPSGASDHLSTDREEFHRVVNQLAFARYEAGDLDEARSWYLTLLDMAPDDPEALRWLARIAYEQGDTSAAVVIWQRLVEVAPDDEGARFFLDLSREREQYGEAASEAYRLGLRAYEAGRIDAALEAFQAAVAANPNFANATIWAGRSALEAKKPELAVRYWENAVALDPRDARSAWFLENARLQAQWGVVAGTAYYAGLAAYDAGELEIAHTEFLKAAEAAPTFKEAFVWTARTSQELGRPDEAIGYWQTVLRLDRNDDRARYFIANARQAIVYGTVASEAFSRGLAAYQAGDGPTAQAEFAAAATASPNFLQAWAQLGRVALQNRDYQVAASAYARAAELAPTDEDYAYFAAEAARLAGASPGREQ